MANAYCGIVEKDPGTLWGVWFPDVPGCVSAGRTADEAVENAADALREHLAGVAAPVATDARTLASNDEVAAALSRGGKLISVPYHGKERASV